MKKLYFLWISLFFLIMIFPIATASFSTLGTFNQHSCISLLQTCADCTYNNISAVQYPNGTLITLNVTMVKVVSDFSFPFCDTYEIGLYTVRGYGDAGSIYTEWEYDFVITGATDRGTLFFGMFLALACIFIFFGYTLQQKIFIFVSATLFILLGVYMMVNANFLLAEGISVEYTRMLSIPLLGFGIYFVIMAGFGEEE